MSFKNDHRIVTLRLTQWFKQFHKAKSLLQLLSRQNMRRDKVPPERDKFRRGRDAKCKTTRFIKDVQSWWCLKDFGIDAKSKPVENFSNQSWLVYHQSWLSCHSRMIIVLLVLLMMGKWFTNFRSQSLLQFLSSHHEEVTTDLAVTLQPQHSFWNLGAAQSKWPAIQVADELKMKTDEQANIAI